MHCWREDCHSECGEFYCVLWHWDVTTAKWIEDDCGIEDVINDFNGHEYWHPDDMDHDQEWDEEYGYMEDYESMDYYTHRAFENDFEDVMEQMPSEEEVMDALRQAKMAFNNTINET